MALVTITVKPSASWGATKRSFLQSLKDAGVGALQPAVQQAHAKALSAAPVYHPEPAGEVLEAPPARVADSGVPPTFRVRMGTDEHGRKRGRKPAWIRSVVRTLAAQYPGLNIDTDPRPNALRDGIGSVEVRALAGGQQVVIGYASRSQLDLATRYHARVLLSPHTPSPEERGMTTYEMNPSAKSSHQITGDDRFLPRAQLLWWNWDEGRWDTYSVVGRPDGGTQSIGAGGGTPHPNWRGRIPAGAGYWADQEFGTEGAQAPGAIPTGPDGNLVLLALQRGPGGAAIMDWEESRAPYAIPPKLFLTKSADWLAWEVFETNVCRKRFTEAVRAKWSTP